MEIVAGAVALGPVALLVLLLGLRLRQMFRRPARPEPDAFPLTGGGGTPGGVREPRRPLVPAGAAGVSLPEPEPDLSDDPGGWDEPVVPRRLAPGGQPPDRLAS